uniref:Uncharacterized protein n=1 Tax=Entamoeba invadens TaxID=33085 RepID=S0B3C0_ENTIV|nr:hypothetical protein, conserved [Entamoeba invadens]
MASTQHSWADMAVTSEVPVDQPKADVQDEKQKPQESEYYKVKYGESDFVLMFWNPNQPLEQWMVKDLLESIDVKPRGIRVGRTGKCYADFESSEVMTRVRCLDGNTVGDVVVTVSPVPARDEQKPFSPKPRQDGDKPRRDGRRGGDRRDDGRSYQERKENQERRDGRRGGGRDRNEERTEGGAQREKRDDRREGGDRNGGSYYRRDDRRDGGRDRNEERREGGRYGGYQKRDEYGRDDRKQGSQYEDRKYQSHKYTPKFSEEKEVKAPEAQATTPIEKPEQPIESVKKEEVVVEKKEEKVESQQQPERQERRGYGDRNNRERGYGGERGDRNNRYGDRNNRERRYGDQQGREQHDGKDQRGGYKRGGAYKKSNYQNADVAEPDWGDVRKVAHTQDTLQAPVMPQTQAEVQQVQTQSKEEIVEKTATEVKQPIPQEAKPKEQEVHVPTPYPSGHTDDDEGWEQTKTSKKGKKKAKK